MVKKFWWYVYSFWHNSRTWQTHGHTDTVWQHRPCLCITSRGKNWYIWYVLSIAFHTNTVLSPYCTQQDAIYVHIIQYRSKNCTAVADLQWRNHVRFVIHRKVINDFHTVAPRREQIREKIFRRFSGLVAAAQHVEIRRNEAEEVASQIVEIEVVNRQQIAVGGRDDKLRAVMCHATSHQAVNMHNSPENKTSISREAMTHT